MALPLPQERGNPSPRSLVTPSRLRAALALAILLLARLCQAQDIEPRRWSHLPIGANFGGAAYAYNNRFTFRPGLWLAASFGYAGGGVTAVNEVPSDNRQSNLGFGVGLGIPINRAVGVKIAYIGTRTQVRTGLDSDTFTCAASVMF